MAAELSSLVPQRGFGRAVRSLHPPPAASPARRRGRNCGLSARPRLVAGRRSTATAPFISSTAALAAAAPTALSGLTVRLTQAVLLILVAFVGGGLLVVVILGMAAAPAAAGLKLSVAATGGLVFGMGGRRRLVLVVVVAGLVVVLVAGGGLSGGGAGGGGLLALLLVVAAAAVGRLLASLLQLA